MPLAPSSPERSPSPPQSISADPEKKPHPDEKSDDRSLDRSENGVSPVRAGGSLTIEALRAEVESDISASGHDSTYDRMFDADESAPLLSQWFEE